MADNLDLAIRIRADLRSALVNLEKMEGGVRDVGREMKRASLGARVFSSTVGQLVRGDLISRGIVALARAARTFAFETVQAGIAAESLAASMRAATGTAATAARELAFVDVEATRLGLDLPTAERAFVSLTAAARGTRLEGAATRDIFTAVAEAARAMGLSAEQQRGALTAIEQIISKGTVSAEELRGQLGERLPGAFQIAARAIGVTTSELGEMLQAGELLAEDFLPRFAAELRRTFAEGAQDAADGPTATFQRLDNAILNLRRTVSQSSGILDFLSDIAVHLTDLSLVANAFLDGSAVEFDVEAYRRLLGSYRETAREIEALQEQLAISATAATDADLSQTTLGQSLTEAEQRLAAIAADLEGLAPHLSLPAAPGTRAAPAASGYLDVPQALRDEIQAEHDRAVAGIRADEELEASDKRRTAEAARTAEARAAAREAELARVQAAIDTEAASLDLLTSLRRTLAGAQATLAGPYEAALHAAERWRAEQERTLAALAAQGHAVEHLGGIVEEVYRDKIAAAVRDAADAEAALADRRLRDATDFESGVTRALRALDAELRDFASLSENAVTGAFRGMEDALVRFVSTGKAGFNDLAQSIIADLARLAIRQQITGPLFGWLSGLFGGGGQALPVSAGLNPGIEHAGGIAGAPGGARRSGVPSTAWFGAPRFHAGGFAGLRSNEVPVILERGEGVFTPEQMRALGSRGAPQQIDVRIDNRGTPQAVQQATPRFDGERLVVDIVIGDLGANGPISQMMQRRFALAGRTA